MSNADELVAAILVGGKGTRLRSVIADVPKPLAPIGHEPFLFHVLRDIAALKIKRVILLTGYRHDQIVAACGNGEQFGLEIQYSREIEPLGTGGALKHAENLLKNSTQFILLNGDTYLDCSLMGFLQQPLKPDCLGLIGTTRPSETERFGSLDIDVTTLQILAFREKSNLSTGWVSAGIYKLASAILDFIPASQPTSLESDIFPKLIQYNKELTAFPLEGEFYDIGVPDSYAAFNQQWIAKHQEPSNA